MGASLKATVVLAALLSASTGYAESTHQPHGPPPGLQRKLEAIAQQTPAWVAAGGRHADLDPLGAKITSYLQAGQFQDAEAVADRLLAVLSAQPTVPRPVRVQRALVAPATNQPNDAAPGLKGYTDAVALAVGNGGDVFSFAVDWDLFEPAPLTYDMHGRLLNGLTLVVDPFPQLRGVVVVLRMIDTNRRVLPADLMDRAFDDPAVLARFRSALTAIAAQRPSKRITYLLLGNEVDAYLAAHPDELPAFKTFYEHAVSHLHRVLPSARVGTVVTFEAIYRPEILEALAPSSDLIAYSYYPVVGSRRGDGVFHWQVRPVADVAADLRAMADRVGRIPFALTEIGCAASPLAGSSDEQQAVFVRELFRTLEPYRRQGRLAFMLYHSMYDYAPGLCQEYARQQGLADSSELCAFVESVGLRRYSDGAPRPAWRVFGDMARRWQGDQR